MSNNNQILCTEGLLLNLKFLVGNCGVFLAKSTIRQIYTETR
jgi:hypothetical protein